MAHDKLLLSGRTSSSSWPGFAVVRAGVASLVVTRTGVRPTLLNFSSSYHTSCRPCARSFFLWTTHAISIFMGAVAGLLLHWRILSVPALPSLQLPTTGQGLFRLVRRRRPLGGAGTTPPVWQIHSSLARHLSICSFSSPTLLNCCLMCHSIFSIQPIPSCIQTLIIVSMT